jgi:lipocalin
MKNVICLTLLACSLQLVSCSKDFDNSTVNEFDLSRYLGVWYEIARYDHSFERGMDNTMAEYILQDNGKVFVLNTGWKNGKFKVAEGKAVYKDPVGEPGAMKVSFFWFFYSEYNVMLVDENYQISLVGSKSGMGTTTTPSWRAFLPFSGAFLDALDSWALGALV